MCSTSSRIANTSIVRPGPRASSGAWLRSLREGERTAAPAGVRVRGRRLTTGREKRAQRIGIGVEQAMQARQRDARALERENPAQTLAITRGVHTVAGRRSAPASAIRAGRSAAAP
jgi:hypothetical protein